MTKKIIIASDLHVPYHDVKAVQLWLQVCNAIGPAIVVINGDLYDFHGISQYDRDPDRRTKLKDEIQTGHAILAMIQADEKHLILGNHEDRLRKYLWRRTPELWGLLTPNEILDVEREGWQITPYNTSLRLGDLTITHDVGHAGITAVALSARYYDHSLVIGHTHRMATHTTRKGRITAASFGWLGDYAKIDYMHQDKIAHSWSHGFGLAYLEDDGSVTLTAVPICADYSCVAEGKRYSL